MLKRHKLIPLHALQEDVEKVKVRALFHYAPTPLARKLTPFAFTEYPPTPLAACALCGWSLL